MKKILILVIILLLAVLCVYVGLNGISLGNFHVLSIKQIQERNTGFCRNDKGKSERAGGRIGRFHFQARNRFYCNCAKGDEG